MHTHVLYIQCIWLDQNQKDSEKLTLLLLTGQAVSHLFSSPVSLWFSVSFSHFTALCYLLAALCSWKDDFCYPGDCPGVVNTCNCSAGFTGKSCLTSKSRIFAFQERKSTSMLVFKAERLTVTIKHTLSLASGPSLSSLSLPSHPLHLFVHNLLSPFLSYLCSFHFCLSVSIYICVIPSFFFSVSLQSLHYHRFCLARHRCRAEMTSFKPTAIVHLRKFTPTFLPIDFFWIGTLRTTAHLQRHSALPMSQATVLV